MPVLLSTRLLQACPPWLQRTVGGKLMLSIGEVVDSIAQAGADGVRARFPTETSDALALALIGRERRIRRGPGEGAVTYTRRLTDWWDDHRERGGPYPLLRQLYAFWLDSLNVPIDVVSQLGSRYQMDTAGAVVRDSITWDGHGGDLGWAYIWVFFHLDDTFPVELITEACEALVTDEGDELVALIPTADAIAAFSSADEETFLAVPREWSAAHIPYVTVVLLYGLGRLWDYPQPVPTWDEWEASGATWDEPGPLILTTE